METLESRIMLTTYLVTTLAGDSSAGSLRAAIAAADADANTNHTANSVVFDVSGTIDLGGTAIAISNTHGSVTISATPGTITLDAGNSSGIANVAYQSTVTVHGLTMIDGSSTFEAGAIGNSGNLTIDECTISGNAATQAEGSYGYGGAIYNNGIGTLTITNSSIANNTAAAQGGGIFNAGACTVINSTISGNVSGSNGGGFYGKSILPTAIINSTITGNAGGGGGICEAAYYTMTVVDSTIAGNIGGGIESNSGVTLNGSIVANNTAGGSPDDITDAVTGSNNLIGDGLTGVTGSNNIDGDPLLGPLGYYGGPTETIPLLPGSPAIGAGATFDYPGTTTAITTDQRGYTRPSTATPDIGAFQSNGVPGPGVVTISPIGISPTPITTGSATTFSVTAGAVSFPDDNLKYNWTLVNLADPSDPVSLITSEPNLTYSSLTTGNWSISLTVSDATRATAATVGPQDFTVIAAPALVITGSTLIGEGQSADFTVTGTAAGNDVAWTATYQEAVEANGTGTQFDFVPGEGGQYTIEASAGSATATVTLEVSYPGPNATILGPATGAAGHSIVFGSQVTQPIGISDPISYQWELLNGDGSPYQYGEGQTAPANDTASYVVPGYLTVGSYEAQLTVSDDHNGVMTRVIQTFDFSVVASVPANFEYSAIPSGGGLLDTETTAVLQQPDGKLVLAGTDGEVDDATAFAWLARLNPDLTLDTSFGQNNTGFLFLGLFGSNDWDPVRDLAFDPVTGDIIVVDTRSELVGFDAVGGVAQVGAILSAPTVEADGAVLPAGSEDPNFNGGEPYDLSYTINPNDTSATYSFARTAIVLTDGSILVGGGVTAVDEHDLNAYTSDFLLFKLTPMGHLDTSFNGTGIAVQPNVASHDDGSNFEAVSADAAISNLVIDPNNGTIYATGYEFGYESLTSGDGFTQGPDSAAAFVAYNSNGTLDEDFGVGGISILNSDLFTDTADGYVFLSSAQLLTNGNLLAAGIASSANVTSFDDEESPANIVFAEIDSATGGLQTSYGSSGIVATTFQTDPAASHFLSVEGRSSTPGGELGQYILGGFTFDGGNVLASVPTSSGWELAEFIGDDGTAADDGQINLSFGINGVVDISSPDPTNWTFGPVAEPNTAIVTDDGIILAGVQIPTLALDNDELAPSHEASEEPIVVRYANVPTPAAADLVASTSPSNTITLKWASAGNTPDGYEIDRSTSSALDEDGLLADGVIIGQVGPGQTDYVDNSAAANTTYYYQVVPLVYASGGTVKPTNIASVSTRPTVGTGYVLQETLTLPVDGTVALSSTTLNSGLTYLLVASGSISLDSNYTGTTGTTGDPILLGDAAYWYSSLDPHGENGDDLNTVVNATADQPTDTPYGIGITTDGSLGSIAIPYWGPFDPDHHQYSYLVTGEGQQLAVQLEEGTNLKTSAATIGGQQPLEIQIYALASSGISPPVSASPVMMITSPATLPDGTTGPIVQSTPIDVLSDNPDGSAAPWALWLVSSSNVPALLASGTNSVGQLPDLGTQVTTLDPSLYPNGNYTLQLTTSSTYSEDAVVDSRSVVIFTAIKSGDLRLPITDGVINTPTGQITISRIYNSSRVNVVAPFEAGDSNIIPSFGAGWSLSLLDSQLSISSQADTYYPNQFSSPVLRAGDLISLTVPDGGQEVFEFDPIPVDRAPAGEAGSQTSIEYLPNFVNMNGTGATLTLPGDSLTVPGDDDSPLFYLPSDSEMEFPASDNVLGYPSGRPIDYGFNPVLNEPFGSFPLQLDFGGGYVLTAKDGTSYTIDAGTGAILSVTDTNGNTTNYTYASGSVTATRNGTGSSIVLFTVNVNGSNQVASINVPGEPSISYDYNSNGELSSVINQANITTAYSYQNSSNPELLTGVTNSSGQTVLKAQYSASSELAALTNASGVTVPISATSLGSNLVLQTTVDAVGDVTENVFNETFGNRVREIELATDADQNPYYIVTVTQYSYVINDTSQMSILFPTGETMLQRLQQFAPFEIAGSDSSGQRYSELPDPNSWIQQVVFDTSNNYGDPARDQIVSQSQRLTSSGTLQTTVDSNYVVVNKLLRIAKPQLVTVEVQYPDANAPTSYDTYIQSKTYLSFDSSGDTLYSVTTIGQPDPGSPSDELAEGTQYAYTSIVDPRLVTSSGNVVADVEPNGNVIGITQISSIVHGNLYYDQTDYTDVNGTWTPNPGAAYDALKYTQNASNQETFYAYNALGEEVLAFTYKEWTLPNGGSEFGWVGTTTVYNALGQVTDTYEATYVDPNGTVSNLTNAQTLPVTTGGPAGIQVNSSVDPLFSGFNGGVPLRTVHNDYNAIGQKVDSIDQYGGKTTYAYDGNGNLIQTAYADGTIVRSVYDALNRQIWITNRYLASDTSTPVIGTYTHYNQLGQADKTETYSGVAITLSAVSLGSSLAFQTTESGGTLVSETDTFYNQEGQAAETYNTATGLKTGTIYYPNGQVEYTGPLVSGLVDDPASSSAWYNNLTFQSDGTLSSTTLSDLFQASQTPGNSHAQYTTNKYDQINSNPVLVTTTSAFEMPDVDHNVTVDVNSTSPFFVGENVNITGVGGFIVQSITDGTTLVLSNLGHFYGSSTTNTVTAGNSVSSGAAVSNDETTTTVSDFNMPAVGDTVTVTVTSTDSFHIGEYLSISGAGGFTILSITSDTTLVLTNLGYNFGTGSANTDPATNISTGANVTGARIYDATIDANGNETDTYKDPLGRIIETLYPDGSSSETLYSIGNTAITKDLEGQTLPDAPGLSSGDTETVQIAQRKSNDPPVVTYNVSDAAGNLTDVYEPAVQDGDPNSPTYYPTYGQPVAPHWQYNYDASGDETDQINPKGGDTVFKYDQFGNEVSRTLPDSTSGSPEIEYSTYNQFNQVATHTDFDGNVATYTYYSGYGSGAYAGLLEEVQYVGSTGHANQTVDYTYTSLGQQKTVSDASGTTTYTYGAFGNLIQEATPEGTINYVFDPATQLHTETWTEANGTSTDKANAITDILYGYDQFGRLASVAQNKINSSTPTATISGGVLYDVDGVSHATTLPTTLYTYDNVGNLLTVTNDGNSSGSTPVTDKTTYTYDSQNRLAGETVTNGSDVTIFSESIIVGDNGLRNSIEDKQFDSNGTLMTDTTTVYSYDPDGRLTGETQSLSGSGVQYSDAYTYDLDNNRMTDVHTGTIGNPAGTTTYAYNGDDELTSQTTGGVTTNNTYDANGSLTSSVTGNQTTSYTYDARNKMVGNTGGPDSPATYVYNDAGDRVQETTGGTTTYYLTDTQNPTGYDQPIEQRSSASGSPQMTYVLGNSVLAQVDNGGTISYLATDGHGSTRALVGSTGAITSNSSTIFNYDAFGDALNFTPSSAGTVFLFGGDAVYDSVSGLYMNGDGVRDRRSFEFIQMDNFAGIRGRPLSLHKYLYADADPLIKTDPTGRVVPGGEDDILETEYEGEEFELQNWENEGGVTNEADEDVEELELDSAEEDSLSIEIGSNAPNSTIENTTAEIVDENPIESPVDQIGNIDVNPDGSVDSTSVDADGNDHWSLTEENPPGEGVTRFDTQSRGDTTNVFPNQQNPQDPTTLSEVQQRAIADEIFDSSPTTNVVVFHGSGGTTVIGR